MSSTSGNHPGATTAGASPSSGDAGNELSRLRQDLANASERISALERRQAGDASGSSSASTSSGSNPPSASGVTTGSLPNTSPGGSVAGSSGSGNTATSEDIARLRQEVSALRDRLTQLEQNRSPAR